MQPRHHSTQYGHIRSYTYTAQRLSLATVLARVCGCPHRVVTGSASTWKADAFRPRSDRLTPVHLTKVPTESELVKHICAFPGSHCQQWRRTSNSRKGSRLVPVIRMFSEQQANYEHRSILRANHLLGRGMGRREPDLFMASGDVIRISPTIIIMQSWYW